MTEIRWGRVAAIAATTAIIQAAIFDVVVPFNVIRLDLPVLLTVAVGFAAVPRDAARIGFAIGLATDLLQFSPFGLYALMLMLAAWSLSALHLRMFISGGGLQTIQGALAAASTLFAVRVGGLAFGLRPPLFTSDALWSMFAIAVAGGLLVHSLMPIARRMLRESGARSSAPLEAVLGPR